MKMVAGNPNLRTYNAVRRIHLDSTRVTPQLTRCSNLKSSEKSKAVGWHCDEASDAAKPRPEHFSPSIPEGKCLRELSTVIRFPTCWSKSCWSEDKPF